MNDADNIRVYHVPLLLSFLNSSILSKKSVSQKTINVRLAGIDAPEVEDFEQRQGIFLEFQGIRVGDEAHLGFME